LVGPIDMIVDYRGEAKSVTRVRTGLQALQLDTLTLIDRFGADMDSFKLIRCVSVLWPVWETWQIFQDLKFRQMSKKINKFSFSSVPTE